jgi:hypothetical protein
MPDNAILDAATNLLNVALALGWKVPLASLAVVTAWAILTSGRGL